MRLIKKIAITWLIAASSVAFAIDGNPATVQDVDDIFSRLVQQNLFTAGPGISISNNVISGNYTAGTGVTVDNTAGTISGAYTAGNGIGISGSEEISITGTGPTLAIGSSYEGAIVFYLDSTGQHGLAAGYFDRIPAGGPLSTGTPTGSTDGLSGGFIAAVAIDAYNRALGLTNTNDTVAALNWASKADGDSCLTSSGGQPKTNCFGRYYLGSASEYKELYDNLATVNAALVAAGGDAILTDGTTYWTSTIPTDATTTGFIVDFSTGVFSNVVLSDLHPARPIRQF